jgi:hypothetical protein
MQNLPFLQTKAYFYFDLKLTERLKIKFTAFLLNKIWTVFWIFYFLCFSDFRGVFVGACVLRLQRGARRPDAEANETEGDGGGGFEEAADAVAHRVGGRRAEPQENANLLRLGQ